MDPAWRALSIVVAVAVLLIIIEMMRRRKLREKYAAIWLALGIGVTVIAAIPAVAIFLSNATGIKTPSNLVLSLAIGVLAMVALHLSTEVGHLEEEVRTSVEEIALLRCELEDSRRELAAKDEQFEQRLAALEAAQQPANGARPHVYTS